MSINEENNKTSHQLQFRDLDLVFADRTLATSLTIETNMEYLIFPAERWINKKQNS